MNNTILYLLGFPGTGKYTIAKEIARRTGARLIDNHLINNAIFSAVGADGKTKLPEEIWDYTRRVGDIVREAIVHLPSPEASFLFANALKEEDPWDFDIYRRIVAVAEQRRSLFVPVRLLCDLPTLQSRIVQHDRRERMKMTDAAAIADAYRKATVFNPGHPHQLELDVTQLEVHEAAHAILAHVKTVSG